MLIEPPTRRCRTTLPACMYLVFDGVVAPAAVAPPWLCAASSATVTLWLSSPGFASAGFVWLLVPRTRAQEDHMNRSLWSGSVTVRLGATPVITHSGFPAATSVAAMTARSG